MSPRKVLREEATDSRFLRRAGRFLWSRRGRKGLSTESLEELLSRVRREGENPDSAPGGTVEERQRELLTAAILSRTSGIHGPGRTWEEWNEGERRGWL